MLTVSCDGIVSNRKRVRPRLLLPIIALLLPCLASAGDTKPSGADCDLHLQSCTRPLSGAAGSVTLGITPKPVPAMTDLVFSVRVSGVTPKAAPYIDLDMPGMKMGPNRVKLKPARAGTYTGSGVIVRCPSGRTLWRATITVPGAGTAAFDFHAVY